MNIRNVLQIKSFVMINTKIIGRPRKFNYDEALRQAMIVFWEKGFNGASVGDLTKAMGISAPSLYSTYGDKRELYLKAIDVYTDGGNCDPILAFESEENIDKAVYNFFDAIIHYSTEHESGAKGCFLASCVSTNVGNVEGVAERIQKSITETEQRLAARFDEEINKGKLPPDFPSPDRASMMFDIRQGYVFRGRAGANAKALRQNLKDRVRVITRI